MRGQAGKPCFCSACKVGMCTPRTRHRLGQMGLTESHHSRIRMGEPRRSRWYQQSCLCAFQKRVRCHAAGALRIALHWCGRCLVECERRVSRSCSLASSVWVHTWRLCWYCSRAFLRTSVRYARLERYRGISLRRKRLLPGPYSTTMPRAVW